MRTSAATPSESQNVTSPRSRTSRDTDVSTNRRACWYRLSAVNMSISPATASDASSASRFARNANGCRSIPCTIRSPVPSRGHGAVDPPDFGRVLAPPLRLAAPLQLAEILHQPVQADQVAVLVRYRPKKSPDQPLAAADPQPDGQADRLVQLQQRAQVRLQDGQILRHDLRREVVEGDRSALRAAVEDFIGTGGPVRAVGQHVPFQVPEAAQLLHPAGPG